MTNHRLVIGSMRHRCRFGTGWNAVVIVVFLTLASVGTAAPPSPDDGSLAARERELAQQFRDLEKTFLRLADLLAPSDPRRASLLRGVFAQARDAEVGDRLDTIVELLEKGQLLKAGTSQASALERLRELLSLLESGEGDKRLATAKEEVKQFVGRLSKIIAKQRDVEGATEAGGREAQLSERQSALADETRGLESDINGFARRMEPKDAADPDAAEREARGERADKERKDAGDDRQSRPDKNRPNEEENGPAAGPSEGRDDEGEKSAQRGLGGQRSGNGERGDKGEQRQEKNGEDSDAEQHEAAEERADADRDDGDDESARARRARKRLAEAEQRMQEAKKRLEEANRRQARELQEKAIEELETARAELEEILRQMREEEVERLLVQLESRLRAMLRTQKGVLSSVEKLAVESPRSDRERELEAARLAREQNGIGADAARALTLVRDDGSAVAIPEALEQVRDDSTQAAARLARADVGGTTRGILQDLVASLEEMIAALEKAQREQQARQSGGPGGRPADPGEQPLVDKLSELKMIRSLQMRVNGRTKRFSKLLVDGGEQAEEPELLDALERLAERQRKIERAAHDIVTGRVE